MVIQEHIPLLLKIMRNNKGFTRGQIAKRLKTTPTVIYNYETGRSRIDLQCFINLISILGFDAAVVLGNHTHSVTNLEGKSTSDIVKLFRTRLRLSQNKLAQALGYKTGSIIHHFEKGIRTPSLENYFQLMILAKDNVRGLVTELTRDSKFSSLFPAGRESTEGIWIEYWSNYYISAMRQIMRSSYFKKMKRYNHGFFSDILGITLEEEKRSLKLLMKLEIVSWVKAKPTVNEKHKIIIPKGIPKSHLDNLKFQWIDFAKKHYHNDTKGHSLSSLDLLPVNTKIYGVIKNRIRALQDEIHNMELTDTDGLLYLGWLANFVEIDSKATPL